MNEKRIAQRLRLFERALSEYTLDEPLSRFLTRFYKENRQMGSSDRRMTSRFCYNYFRLGHAFSLLPIAERLALAEYLCETESDIVAVYRPELNDSIADDLEKKIIHLQSLYGDFLQDIFPFATHLSTEVDASKFIKSFFVQPHLYIRAKKNRVGHIRTQLEQHNIPFKFDRNTTFSLRNGQNLQQIKGIAGDYEVQDLSSQRTIAFFNIEAGQSWWDCCAASGGKSLMLLDHCPNIKLMVSDIRLSILRNLDERFLNAGIKVPYQKKILDLNHSVSHLMGENEFDRILLDAPCSGSGTWARTPEMMQQFTEEKIAYFSKLQQNIATNVLPYLKTGGQLIYITCSVFAKENEKMAAFIESSLRLSLINAHTLSGYGERADSMYIATFRKD